MLVTTGAASVICGVRNMNRVRSLFQLWTRRTETVVLDVMLGKRHGGIAAVLRVWLLLLGKLFEAIVKLRGRRCK